MWQKKRDKVKPQKIERNSVNIWNVIWTCMMEMSYDIHVLFSVVKLTTGQWPRPFSMSVKFKFLVAIFYIDLFQVSLFKQNISQIFQNKMNLISHWFYLLFWVVGIIFSEQVAKIHHQCSTATSNIFRIIGLFWNFKISLWN